MSNISETVQSIELISPQYPSYTDSITEATCIITPETGQSFRMTTIDAWITSTDDIPRSSESYLNITVQTVTDTFSSNIHNTDRFQRHFENENMTEIDLKELRIDYFSEPGELKFVLKLEGKGTHFLYLSSKIFVLKSTFNQSSIRV